MPLPAQPIPGVGPPASTHNIPLYPSTTISFNSKSSFFLRTKSKTVFISLPLCRFVVESAFGSHPICITFNPFLDKATDRFEIVVDLPIPPFP